MESVKLVSLSVLLCILMATTTTGVRGYCLLGDLQPCFPAAKPSGPAPSPACCDIISKLTPDCLCQAVSGPDAPKAGVNITAALVLPIKCGVTIPAGTTCGGFPVPT